MPEMTGGDAVYHALRAIGVDHVFGIASVHNIPIYDAIHRNGGIIAVAMRHEQAAVHAADAYARATGKLGVAIASTGPGTANCIAGLYEAGFASSPVMLITGQIDTHYYGKGKGFLHEADNQVAMLRSVTRRTESVRRMEDIADTIVRVATDVHSGRPQPGAVEIPIDLQYATANVDVQRVKEWPLIEPDRRALADAIAALKDAKRPLIWAGGGVVIANAAAELARLAEMLQAPVITSISGRGAIREDHPLCLGPLTDRGPMQEVLAEADVVFAVGTRFQARLTRNWTLQIPGKLVHLDADPGVIGRNYPVEIGVIGDARLGLAAIIRGLKARHADSGFVARAQRIRDDIRTTIRKQVGPDFEAIMVAIRDYLPHDSNIVRDVTVPATQYANRILPILVSRTSINPVSTAIGPGLPFAIGAAVGTGKKTLLITGDGGFMLHIGELATAVQYNSPVIVCIFNDRGYGVLRNIQARQFEGRQTGVDLVTPDFTAVAQAMGMRAESVNGVDEFRSAFKRAVDTEGPVLLDVDMRKLHPITF